MCGTLITYDKAGLGEQLDTVTRERTAALEAMQPGRVETRKSDLEAGWGRKAKASESCRESGNRRKGQIPVMCENPGTWSGIFGFAVLLIAQRIVYE